MKTGDTLYCLDGSTVILRYFDDEILMVEYKGKLYRRPKSAIGKTLLLQPLTYEDAFSSPGDAAARSATTRVENGVIKPLHAHKDSSQAQIEQKIASENQVANVEEKSARAAALDNGEIFVGRVLYDKKGMPLTVYEIHEENEK